MTHKQRSANRKSNFPDIPDFGFSFRESGFPNNVTFRKGSHSIRRQRIFPKDEMEISTRGGFGVFFLPQDAREIKCSRSTGWEREKLGVVQSTVEGKLDE